MKIAIQKTEPVKVTFPVRAMIREGDLKRLRGERFDAKIEHIDIVVELGAEDFGSDDERLFAADFEETLRLERSGRAFDYGQKPVPGKLVLERVAYPLDSQDLSARVVGFLREGVEEGREVDRIEAELKAKAISASQMVVHIAERFLAEKTDLQQWCEGWLSRVADARKALDVDLFDTLLAEKKRRLKVEPGDLLKELAKEIERSLGELAKDMAWTVQTGLLAYSERHTGTVQRLAEGPPKGGLEVTLFQHGWRDETGIQFEGKVESRLFRWREFSVGTELQALNRLLKLVHEVAEDDSKDVFERDVAGRKKALLERERKAWIKKFGSAELNAAVSSKNEYMPTYARERFRHRCASVSQALEGFAFDVDARLFWSARLIRHSDPSAESLRLISAIEPFVSEASCNRLESMTARVEAVNDEVVLVSGESIAPDCPDLYLWRPAATKGRRKRV